MDERVMVVDDQNRPAGSAPRSFMRASNLFHRAVYILVYNSEGKLFRHQRTFTKDLYPGVFDAAAGGVVLEGETYETAAARELSEELGIRNVPLEFLFDLFFEAPGTRVFGRAFRCIFDGEMVLQPEEILAGEFLTPEKILLESEQAPYTPDSLVVLRRFLDEGFEEIKAF